MSTPVFAVGVIFERLLYERFFAYVSGKHPQFNNKTFEIEDIPEKDIWYLEEGNCFQNQESVIQSVPKRMRQKPKGAIIDTNIRI